MERRAPRVARSLAAALLLLLTPFSHGAPATKPKLTLKALPAIGTTSTIFLFQAILSGGEDTEDFYCLGIEWIWEEQLDSSLNEAECPPFKPGETRIERSFSEEQTFHSPGPHVVKVVLRKGEKVIGTASVSVRVREEP
jgi:hypothetical protein